VSSGIIYLVKTLPSKTRRAWDEPGHAHFLTYSCLDRLKLLNSDRGRRWLVEAMDRTRRTHDLAIWAYVIMPEHVHALLHPLHADYAMRRILAALKRPVADAARDHLKLTGDTTWLRRLSVTYPSRTVLRFWQPGGGFDHSIFREKTLETVLEYIHENPVRRGLVQHSTDWEWSSARYWEGQRDVPIRMDHPDV